MTRATIIVPPFIKYNAGPLLGPSLLQAAARKAGHTCSVLDLNAIYIKKQQQALDLKRGRLVGDHDKPLIGTGISFLTVVEDTFLRENILSSFSQDLGDAKKRVLYGFLDHDDARKSASALAGSSPFGTLAMAQIKDHVILPPQVIGVSVLHAGQVIPAVAITMITRQLFPDALVIWGGPHVSGLGTSLESDLQQRSFAADLFVTGHAEKTFVDILDHVDRDHSDGIIASYRSCVSLVQGEVTREPISPSFDNLTWYDDPLTLPAQSSLGCVYGRCKFCTYPAIEPTPTKLHLDISVGSVVETALSVGARNLAIKDSLATPLRLRQIAGIVDGKVQWSACTKLSKRLDRELLLYLRKNGLATLEVGLESLLPETQRKIDKVQPPELFSDLVRTVSSIDGMSLVANYMTGFPWEDPAMSIDQMIRARDFLENHLGSHGHLEHNSFELERLSPMRKNPGAFNIDPDSVREWPWSSVVAYKAKTTINKK